MNKKEWESTVWTVIAGALIIIIVTVGLVKENQEGKEAQGMDVEVVSSRDEAASYTFEALLDAIEWVESRGDPDAVCPDGCCIGAYQLTKIYIDDCNRIAELYNSDAKVYNYHRWDKEISRTISTIVMCYYANIDFPIGCLHDMQFFETAARTHKNPSKRNHPDTLPYWLKVRERMEAANAD